MPNKRWLFASLALAAIIGCGGHHSSDSSTDGGGTESGGCGGILKNAAFSVDYPVRSRATGVTGLSSALSGKFVIANGAATGSETINFNRNSSLTSHTETYAVSSVETSATSGVLTLYADANQSGAVVGTATVPLTVTCSNFTLGSFTLDATVQKVAVAPATITVGSAAQQLTFTASDSSSKTVAVTPGSAIFSAIGSAATVTNDGIVTPVSAGSITVTATVDGVNSAPATITVQTATTFGHGYHIVDLGPSAVTPGYGSISPRSFGRLLNDAGKCVIYDLTASQFDVVDYTKPSVRTPLGSTNNQSHISAIDAQGDVIGGNFSPAQPLYWKSSDYTTPIILKGIDVSSPTAENASGAIVGYSFDLNAGYWSNFNATANILPTLATPSTSIDPHDINASGLIVGSSSDDKSVYTPIYYANPSAKPALLQQLSGITSGEATTCNDSGMIAGYGDTMYGPDFIVWSSPTAAAKFAGGGFAYGMNNSGVVVGANPGATTDVALVYTAANGMKNLYDLADSSRTGWNLADAFSVNASGAILGQGFLNGKVHMFVAVPNG